MKKIVLISVVLILIVGLPACEDEPQAATGIRIAKAEVTVGADGLTIEQANCKNRLGMDNIPGSIKHLYVLSAYSGQVIIYSTVKGKVTSSTKRLTPDEVYVDSDMMGRENLGFVVPIGNQEKRTSAVLQDDGTYGSSIPYLYWWDSQGRYHQHYVSGGQILHISDQPLAVKSIILNMEVTTNE